VGWGGHKRIRGHDYYSAFEFRLGVEVLDPPHEYAHVVDWRRHNPHMTMPNIIRVCKSTAQGDLTTMRMLHVSQKQVKLN
jgi:hypothetical protein